MHPAAFWALTGLLVLLVIQESGWCWTYYRSAWRTTPFGWAWLLKGCSLDALFVFLLVNQFVAVHVIAWLIVGALLNIAVGIWWRMTVRARRGALKRT